MAVNPQKGEIIRAKETSANAYDDILGQYRRDFVRNVEASIQYSISNVPKSADQPTYKIGIYDSQLVQKPEMNQFSDTEIINNLTYYFKKNGTGLVEGDVFGPATMVLPDDGQVPQNTGDLVDGQVSYFDVNDGAGLDQAGVLGANRTSSVANAIAQHTILLTRVRKANILYRQAVTKVGWQSKHYPATFQGTYTVPLKNDPVGGFVDGAWKWPELYQMQQQESKAGITSLVSPFSSALDWMVIAQTIGGDLLRGPREDPADVGPGPDEFGVFITADDLKTVFQRMKGLWEEAKEYNMSVVFDYCHTSCHASCHKSRSRR